VAPRADAQTMDVSGVSSVMSGVAAAQGMFGVAAQVASGVASPDAGGGSAAEAIQVALLQRSLDLERSVVNILA
jgi:hypothetical protein